MYIKEHMPKAGSQITSKQLFSKNTKIAVRIWHNTFMDFLALTSEL